MICIWVPVEQHALLEVDFLQNSTFRSKLLENTSTIPLKYSPLRTAFLASWLVHICGLIMRQLQFSVLYITLNVSKRE
jgi:hypothetical protein